MGNTVTKESGAGSTNTPGADTRAGRSCCSARGSSSRAQFGEAYCSSSSRTSCSHHSGAKPHKSRREGYEMIIDPNETVDGGYLFPQGVYHGGQDFKVSVVRDMIVKRRLAPFYKGLDAVDPEWSDEELLEKVRCTIEAKTPPKPGQLGTPTDQQQIWLYSNVHECPICFLVYPRLNGTRCCAQDICTECFVQIKRNPPHPPYTTLDSNAQATDVLDLISEPAACPYCAQPDLGVIFDAPPFEWGILSKSSRSPSPQMEPSSEKSSLSSLSAHASTTLGSGNRKRRPSMPVTHPQVVTIDMIRPDWEDKLASAHRRLARKSAAARALHRSALLPHDGSGEHAQATGTYSGSWAYRDISSVRDAQRAVRSLSAAQSRALEQRMVEEAIQASLAHQ